MLNIKIFENFDKNALSACGGGKILFLIKKKL